MSASTDPGGPRIAIVHEWLSSLAGSEQVFLALSDIYPQADLYALDREPGLHLPDSVLRGRPVRTTMLDRPWLRRHRALELPLMPLAWSHFGRPEYDIVITSSHAFAHANRLARPGATRLTYVHSPARYVWSPEIDQRGATPLLEPVRRVLRTVDRHAAERTNFFAANSTAVAERIDRFWRRQASVIYPPVKYEFFAEEFSFTPTRDYVLGFGRWIRYKNLPLVIAAADRAGVPVKIAGRGPDENRIAEAARRARVPVEIIESPSDEELRDLYRNALCLVFPTIEDFGIVPVEAQAAGTPVVAVAEGGALDTVSAEYGHLAASASPADLAAGIRDVQRRQPRPPLAHVARFGADRFRAAITGWVDSAVGATVSAGRRT